MSETKKEIDQEMTPLTEAEVESVSGGTGLGISGGTGFFFSEIEIASDGTVLINGEQSGTVKTETEYIRCCKCNNIIGVRNPGDPKTGCCFRCRNRIKARVRNSSGGGK